MRGLLGAHVDDDTRKIIWGNQFIDIWSLVSIDRHMVDREASGRQDYVQLVTGFFGVGMHYGSEAP